MLLFRSSNYPRVKESKKSADFILENIIENTFILMQGENTLLERRPKFKSNRFGSIYEFRRVCNTCGLQQYMTIIKKIEHAQTDERQYVDEIMKCDLVESSAKPKQVNTIGAN